MAYTFDGATKIIELSTGTTAFDVVELYSRWKEWVIASGSGYELALTTIGGDDLGGGVRAGDYYFLQPGWTILPQDADHVLQIAGNLYPSVAGINMFSSRPGRNVQVQMSRSSLTQSLAIGSGVLPADITAIAEATRNEILSDATPFAGANIDAPVSTAGGGLTEDERTWLIRIATLLGVPNMDSIRNLSSGTVGPNGLLSTVTTVSGQIWRNIVTRNGGTSAEDVTVIPGGLP